MSNHHRDSYLVFNPGNDFQKPSRTGFVDSIFITHDCDQPRRITYHPRGFPRSAGELSTSSGRSFRFRMISPTIGAAFNPRLLSGRAKSLRDLSSQLDLACLSNRRVFTTFATLTEGFN